PMLLWNGIGLALVSGFATWGRLKAPVPSGIGEALDWIGCVTRPNPINVQISFLRDLFLCMCAAPLLARLPTRGLWLAWGVALAWSIAIVPWPILLRPPILLFFVTGMLARRAGLAERIATWPLWACTLPYLLLVPVKIWLSADAAGWWMSHVAAANAIDLPMRFAAALALWRVALALAPGRLGRLLLLRGERYAFLLFCCHLVLIWLIGPVIGHAVGKLGAPGYPFYLLLQPLLALGATVLVALALERVSRPLAGLLSGGRLSGQRPAPLPKPAASA
ncbi:MAG TPA: acyltransferase family protein, partial [Sphingomonas sp.]